MKKTIKLRQEDLAALPPRPSDAHKGTFGRVLVVGGSLGMSGAAYFTAKATLRAGAGLCEIFTVPENRVIYQTMLPEAMVTAGNTVSDLRAALKRASAIAVGMGLGQSRQASAQVFEVLANTALPLVADADALNAIAADSDLFSALCNRAHRAPTVVTPHLGEMSRLTGRSIAELASDMPKYARDFARQTSAVTVLKSARTVISDGDAVWENTFGNSGMATGGSGDVLAGVITSFLAQGATPADAARLGVLSHALAGDRALAHRGNHGLMASDIIDGLCEILL